MPMPATEGLNADLLDVRDDAMLTPRRAGGLLTQRDHAGRGGALGWLGLAGCVCFAAATVYLLATVHSHAGKLDALQATVDAKYVLKTESAAQVNTSTQGERGGTPCAAPLCGDSPYRWCRPSRREGAGRPQLQRALDGYALKSESDAAIAKVAADGSAGREAAAAALAELKVETLGLGRTQGAHYAEFQAFLTVWNSWTTATFPAALQAYVRTAAMNSTLEAYARRCLTGGPYVQ